MSQVDVEKLISKFYHQFCQVKKKYNFYILWNIKIIKLELWQSSNRVVVIIKVVSEWLEKRNGYKGATVFFKKKKKDRHLSSASGNYPCGLLA